MDLGRMKSVCLFSLLSLLFLLTGCGAGEGGAPRHLEPVGAAKLIEQSDGVTVIDVRTPHEFASGAIPGARNLDVQSASFERQVAGLDPEGSYLLYCRSGNRTALALPVFQQHGLKPLYHLDGGLKAWSAAGYPLSR